MNEIPLTQEGKPVKDDNRRNRHELTAKQQKCGDLKGKQKYWSEKLRCWFYVKDGKDPLDVEQHYITSIENEYKIGFSPSDKSKDKKGTDDHIED